ncbi:MAG: hypothetical protein HY812_05400 [Planctomycetes bacterium]|nr:hypothetical protein [Planctomycetota bacterium]
MRSIVLLLALAAPGGVGADEHGVPLQLKKPRVLFSATPTLAGRILVAGGLSDSSSPLSARGDAELLDPARGAERVVASLPLGNGLLRARAWHAAAPLDDGRVLIAGGIGQACVLVYEPDGGLHGAFVSAGPLPGGPRADLTATPLLDGRVLLCGGMDVAGKPAAHTDLFDPTTSTLAAGPSLLRPRSAHAAVLLEDGRVLIAGGIGEDTTELFDPAEGTFVAGPRLLHVRDDLRATRLLDGRVLLTGGQDEGGRTTATAELFDPASNELTRAADLHADRADHAQLLLPDGRVLLLGGEHDDAESADLVLDSVECFDPESGDFRLCPPLSEPRDDHQAVLLQDGRVAVIAGQGKGDVALCSVEFYAPPAPAE